MPFKHPIPAAYDYNNSQIGQVADILPDYALPSDKGFIGPCTKAGWTQPLMIRKGNTHYNQENETYEVGTHGYNASMPGRSFWDVARINDSFGMNSSTTQAQCEAFANQMDLNFHLVIFETMENVNTLEPEAKQWRWFHDRYKQRRDAQTAIDGLRRDVAHNYFWFQGGIWGVEQVPFDKAKELYTTPLANWGNITYQFNGPQRAINNYSPGGTLASTTLLVQGVYLGDPHTAPNKMINAYYAMDITRMQGKRTGLYVFGVHEWRPDWIELAAYPDGNFERKKKLRLPKSVEIWSGFMAMDRGHVCCAGTIAYQPATKKPVEYYYLEHGNRDWWYSPASDPTPKTFPYYGGSGLGRFNFGGPEHVTLGGKLWHDTMQPVYTPGEVSKGMAFRINDGSWIEPDSHGADILRVWRDRNTVKAGLANYRMKNGKIGFYYWNPYGPPVKQKIEFRHPTNPSITWVRYVCSDHIHAELVTL